MGLPQGQNNGAHGVKGRSGRKSHFAERVSADFLVALWQGQVDPLKVQKKLKSKRYGGMHVFASQVLGGDKKMMAKLMDKLFPNMQRIETNTLNTEEAREELNALIRDAKTTIANPTPEDRAAGEEAAVSI